MWTLIKAGLWFSLVLVLLPVFHSGSSERLANAPPVNFTDAFGVASGAYDYVANLCTEKPDVCEKGGRTFTALGFRAKEGALIAYDYLNSKFADKNAPALPEKTVPAVAEAARPMPDKAEAPAAPQQVAETALGLGGQMLQAFQPSQPMPAKPQPYRPPVMDKVVTGTVPQQTRQAEADAAVPLPAHVPVPLPRPYPQT